MNQPQVKQPKSMPAWKAILLAVVIWNVAFCLFILPIFMTMYYSVYYKPVNRIAKEYLYQETDFQEQYGEIQDFTKVHFGFSEEKRVTKDEKGIEFIELPYWVETADTRYLVRIRLSWNDDDVLVGELWRIVESEAL